MFLDFTWKDLTALAGWARQDLINSVEKLYILQYAGLKLPGRTPVSRIFFLIPGKRNRLIRKARAEIKEKRIFLDDIEQALDLAQNYDLDEIEKRDFYKDALEKSESEDRERYEKKMEAFEKEIERRTDRLQSIVDQVDNWVLLGVLNEIRKQLAEIFFSIDRIAYQNKRRREWELYGPPAWVDDEFKRSWDEFKRSWKERFKEDVTSINTTPRDSEEKKPEAETIDFSERILCSDGNCIGFINGKGFCEVCGKPSTAH